MSGFKITNGLSDDWKGGGIICDSSSPTITNVTVSGNRNMTADYGYGAGIHCLNSSPTITNATISENTAGTGGGGIHCQDYSSPTITNVTISGNTAGSTGGGMVSNSNSSPTLINVTISGNTAGSGGGFFWENSWPSITNSIIYHNTGSSINKVHGGGGGAISITNSNFNISSAHMVEQDLHIGVGVHVTTNANGDSCDVYNNIQLNPLFVDADNDDYRLSDYSPAIGVGTATGAPATDIDGNRRPNPEGSNPDMGAFENIRGTPYLNTTPTISAISDTTILEDAGQITIPISGITDGSDSETDSLFLSVYTNNSNVENLTVNYSSPDSTGTVSFSFAEDSSGVAEITVKLEDDVGIANHLIDSVVTSFTITVLPVNDAPALTAISDTVMNEDSELHIDIEGYTFDVEGDNIYHHAWADTTGIDTPNVIVYFNDYEMDSDFGLIIIPEDNWHGTTTVYLSAIETDTEELYSDTISFILTVLPVNDAPVMTAISDTSFDEDDSLLIALEAYDVDGDSLSFYDSWSQEFISVNQDTLTIDPPKDWNGQFSSWVYVTDGELVDSSEFNVNVIPVNDAPTLTALSDTTINEDSELSIFLEGYTFDAEGDNIYHYAWTDTTELDAPDVIVYYNDYDSLKIIPAQNWHGSTIIYLSATETNTEELYSDTTSFIVTVLPVNDAPVMTAINDTSFYEDDSLLITIEAYDVDGDILSFYEPYDQEYISIIDDTLLIKAPQDWNGQFWGSIHVADGELYDSTQFMIDIIPVNDAPEITAILDTSMQEDSNLILELHTLDVDGDTLSYEIWSDNDFAIFNIDSIYGYYHNYIDTLTITPYQNWFGSVEIYVRVFDNALSDTMNFTLTVESVDDLPTADMPFADVTMYEDSPDTTLGNLDSLFTDLDGELEFSVSVGDSSLIDVTINENLASLHLAPDAFGSTNIIFTAKNPTRAMVKDTVTVEILAVNDMPTIDIITDITIFEDSGQLLVDLSGISTGADNENQEITISASFSDSNIFDELGSHNYNYSSLDSTGSLELFTSQHAYGSTIVTVKVHDNAGDSVLTQFTIDVESVNDVPELELIGIQSVDEDSSLSLKILATDVENDELLFNAIPDTNGVQAFVYGDSLKLVPSPDWNGEANITVTASDGLLIDTTTFVLNVIALDDEPVITYNIPDINLNEDFSDSILAQLDTVFNDIDGYLEYSLSISDTTVFSANISLEGVLTLISNENAFGETELVITASNSTRGTISDTILVMVQSINDIPVIETQINSLTLDEDTQGAFIDLVAFDIETQALTYGGFSDTSAIQLLYNDTGRYAIELEPHWFGTSVLTMFVGDEDGASDTLEISLSVTSVNDIPEFTSDLSALVGAGMAFEQEINTFDADMDQLTLSFNNQTTVPEWLTLSENMISGVPLLNGEFTFLIDLSDNDTTVTDTFYLTVEVFNPIISSIIDIPEDQGGRVYLGFSASYFDTGDETGQEYGIYRYDTYADSSAWVAVASGPAIHQEHYVFEVTTLGDSTAGDNGMSMYKVVASMNEGIFHSLPDSGYSIDNIAPGVPTGMQAMANENSISLSWDISEAEDFQYFVLERSNETINGVADTTISYELVDANYEDLNFVRNVEYSYKLAAYDYAGNRSEFTEPVSVILLSIDPLSLIPDVFALHQNYPNPFNPTTQIRYDLPDNEFVSINIYDVMGRKIKSLVSINQETGYRSITWNATNDLGQPVSAGMYIYTIQAGEFRQTRKMVLLK
ncbi:tandem-95 repeat protein [Candidatus Marinimicrobia bacterium]|nr:tandem-95 repeat protein [Candidatus Neomarinimicrobiota bacterium]